MKNLFTMWNRLGIRKANINGIFFYWDFVKIFSFPVISIPVGLNAFLFLASKPPAGGLWPALYWLSTAWSMRRRRGILLSCCSAFFKYTCSLWVHLIYF